MPFVILYPVRECTWLVHLGNQPDDRFGSQGEYPRHYPIRGLNLLLPPRTLEIVLESHSIAFLTNLRRVVKSKWSFASLDTLDV